MSLHQKPKLAVIIPNHNYGNWIDDAISSVCDDQYDNKKIFVIDDGSTDNSAQKIFNNIKVAESCNSNEIPAICGKYKNTNVDIVLISYKESRGPSCARNIGIKAAWNYADVFSFLDSDDMHINGKIKNTLNELLKGWGVIGAVYSDYINIDVETNIKYYQYKKPFCSENILVDCIMPSNSLVPKYVFEKIGFFDETMRVAEDWDFWIRMSKHYIAYHIPKFLSIVRMGKYNSTNTVHPSVWHENWKKIREKINNG